MPQSVWEKIKIWWRYKHNRTTKSSDPEVAARAKPESNVEARGHTVVGGAGLVRRTTNEEIYVPELPNSGKSDKL